MKVLVTGGSGFVGHHTVRRLLKEEHSVTVVDYQADDIDKAKQTKVNFVQIGAEDPKCERLFADTLFDIVIHLACKKTSSASADFDMQNMYLNHASLSNVLYLSLKYHVRKVIVLSSYAIYGKQDKLPIAEDARLNPLDLPGYHDQSRENQCQEYRQLGLNVVVLRTSYIVGPAQNTNLETAVRTLLCNAFPDREPVAPGKLDCLYISDLVEAIINTMVRETPSVVNISSGIGTTKNDLISCMRDALDELSADTSAHEANKPDDRYKMMVLHEMACTDQDVSVEVSPMSEAIDYILDNSLAVRELIWQPKYDLAESVRKTLSWYVCAPDQAAADDPYGKVQALKRPDWVKKLIKPAEAVVFGIFALLVTYLVQYRLKINIDILLIYVSLISLFYGLRQGSLAIVLAVISRIFLLLFFDRKPVLLLAINIEVITQLVLYLVVGVCISYAVDARIHRQENTEGELKKVKEELSFVNILYQKSLVIKNSLQFAIENNANSLGKLIHLISRLERAEQTLMFDEAVHIFADILKVNTVLVYCADATGKWLRLTASIGEATYGNSIQTTDYRFLDEVIKDQRIFINTELKKEYPQVCTPLFVDDMLEAIVFIDGIDFINLTQHFINTLKALTILVSESIERKLRFENISGSGKFILNTYIMKKEWFEKSIHNLREQSTKTMLLLKINNKIFNYRSLNRVINNLIRSVDSIGELSDGQLGIILMNFDKKFLPVIIARFAEKGLSVDQIELEDE